MLPIGQRRNMCLRVRIGSGGQQRTDDVDMPFVSGPHQRRLILIVVGGIRIRAGLEQQLDRVEPAGP